MTVDLKTALNAASMLLTAAGVVLIYRNSPANFTGIEDSGDSTDYAKTKGDVALKNHMMRVGTRLLLIGVALQFGALFIP